MSVVHLENLKEDMMLSQEVTDIKGRLLLRKGQKIEHNHIRILKMWGVTEVCVVGDVKNEEGYDSSVDQELFKKIEESTKQRFKFADMDHPAMKELFRVSVNFRMKNNIKGQREIRSLSHNDQPTNHITPNILEKIKNRELKLPEIPNIVFELNDIMADPRSSAEDIAQIVSKSPSLATILLKIVNSSFYSFPSKIDSISRAVTIIGTKEITNLSMGISVINIFKGIPRNLIDMRAFMRHGFACGIISRILGAQKDTPQTEQLFVSGLLHDIGRAVVYKYFPHHAHVLLNHSSQTHKLLYKQEKDCLGCRHTDLGKFLLIKWNLPVNLANNIFCHHNPSNANNPIHASIVHLADILANALELGSSGERFVPPLDNKAWDDLGIPASCFGVVTRQAVNQLSAFDTFLQKKIRT